MAPLLPTMKDHLSSIWKSAAPQFERGMERLTRPRDPIDWKTVRTRASSWLLPNSIASRALAVIILAVVLVGIIPWLWQIYVTRFPAIIPLGAGIGGAIIAWAALTQAATARRRHEAQTAADLQRRITESFSKATEQLGSDKLEVRLGGIYTLERISRESLDDYWTVMENLAAFVRERSWQRQNERIHPELQKHIATRAYFLWLGAGRPEDKSEHFWAAAEASLAFHKSETDLAAVFLVMSNRSRQGRYREIANGWHIDLRRAYLERFNLSHMVLERVNLLQAHLEDARLEFAHLEEAHLVGAHLEHAFLFRTHLEHSNLSGAHLQRARFADAHFEDANLAGAGLQGALLVRTHLEGANLTRANLEGASLMDAHLERADLSDANALSQAQIEQAFGDPSTKLPAGLTRPAHWSSGVGGG